MGFCLTCPSEFQITDETMLVIHEIQRQSQWTASGEAFWCLMEAEVFTVLSRESQQSFCNSRAICTGVSLKSQSPDLVFLGKLWLQTIRKLLSVAVCSSPPSWLRWSFPSLSIWGVTNWVSRLGLQPLSVLAGERGSVYSWLGLCVNLWWRNKLGALWNPGSS